MQRTSEGRLLLGRRSAQHIVGVSDTVASAQEVQHSWNVSQHDCIGDVGAYLQVLGVATPQR
jgi:hypothetical protein